MSNLNEEQKEIIGAFVEDNLWQVEYPAGIHEWWYITQEILEKFACDLVEATNETSD